MDIWFQIFFPSLRFIFSYRIKNIYRQVLNRYYFKSNVLTYCFKNLNKAQKYHVLLLVTVKVYQILGQVTWVTVFLTGFDEIFWVRKCWTKQYFSNLDAQYSIYVLCCRQSELYARGCSKALIKIHCIEKPQKLSYSYYLYQTERFLHCCF